MLIGISLTKIYADLCACCDKPKRRCTVAIQNSSKGDNLDEQVNHFECLALEEATEVEDSSFFGPLSSCPECTAEAPAPCPGTVVSDMALAEDDLGVAIEMGIILQRLFRVFEDVKACWSRATDKHEGFIAAAFVTNVAYASVTRLERDLRELEEQVDLTQLQRTCSKLHGHESSEPSNSIHSLIEALMVTKIAISHCTSPHEAVTQTSTSKCLQPICGYVRSTISAKQGQKPSLVEALITNILQLVESQAVAPSIVQNCALLCGDLDSLVQCQENKPAELRLTLGLTLLSGSNIDYFTNASGPKNPPSCRVIALRLAQQATNMVHQVLKDKTCFPCRCTQTIAFHLQNLAADLSGYTSYKCWDLFFQSPWVAGSHILEMLDLCQYYGMRLFHYRHYIGSVLHSYNVLQQLAGIDEIPLLEWLCDHYQGTFFPGGRPSSSFRACWTRYIGARLRFKKGHRSSNSRDSWCMAIPAHAAQKAAGLGISRDPKDDKGESLLFKIKQQQYVISDEQRTTIHRDPTASVINSRCANKSSRSETKNEQNSEETQLPSLLRYTETLFTPTPDNLIPEARLNHFAVFATCIRIISTLSDATHTDSKDQKGMNCICFANAILNGGDRVVQARKLGRSTGSCWTKDEREGVLKMTSEALDNEVRGRRVEEWMWDL